MRTYKWKDANGVWNFSDTLPEQAVKGRAISPGEYALHALVRGANHKQDQVAADTIDYARRLYADQHIEYGGWIVRAGDAFAPGKEIGVGTGRSVLLPDVPPNAVASWHTHPVIPGRMTDFDMLEYFSADFGPNGGLEGDLPVADYELREYGRIRVYDAKTKAIQTLRGTALPPSVARPFDEG